MCELFSLPFFFFFGTPFLCGLYGIIFLKKQILLLVQDSFKDGHKQLCLENCPQEPWHLIPEALGGSTVPSHPSNTKEDISAGDFRVFDLVFVLLKSIGGASPQSDVFRQSLGLCLSCGSGLSEVCFGFPAITSEGGNGLSEAGIARLMQ